MSIIYLNGKFIERDEASLDPLDRGVLLGDGIFETVRCEGGQLLFHVAHFGRIGRGARLLEIPFNMTSEELLQICQHVLDANHLREARLRITLTRGELGNSPEIGDPATSPTLIVHVGPFDRERLEAARLAGWNAHMIRFPLNHRSPLARIKSTCYQEHLLGRLEARRAGADEGIFLNTDGLLAEGAMSNLFIVRGETVLTPPVEDGALPGIVRLKVGIICDRLGIEYREESLTLEDLDGAREAFMTNSLIELMPLVRVGGHRIADGTPGEVTRRLHREHRRDVETFLAIMRSS